MRGQNLVLVLAFVFSGVVKAAIPSPSYGTPVTGTGFYLQPGSVSEASCDPPDAGPTTCSADFQVTLPTNYANGVGVIYLRNFYLGFADSAGGAVKGAKLMLSRNSYNSSTGVFSWHLEASLDANPAPSTDVFNFGFDFGIVIVDNTNFRATEKTAANFAQVGTGNPCDSSYECEDTTTYSAVGTSGAPFRQMLLRGFDVKTTSGAGLSLSQLRFDVAGVTPNSSTQAGGAAYCTATASTTEELQCELGLAAIGFATNHLTNQKLTSYITGKVGTYSNAYSANSTSGSAASNFIFGLQTSDHSMASSSTWKNVSSGCGDTFFSSSPGTGSVSGYARHGFVSPTTPSVTYASYVECFVGFIY
jgi:hypothetical protein